MVKHSATREVRRYQDEVPAVARAVRVLERLAGAPAACSLADLARELRVGPSSLLAILTTLRRAGLVARDAAGRYQAGAGLAALGSAAAGRLRACERFAAVAEQLVAATGETALLWIRHEGWAVLAAAREGTHPVRYVPTPGLKLALESGLLQALTALEAQPGTAAPSCVELPLAPGVWMIAAPLATGTAERAAVALAGPRERLAGPAVRPALLTARDAEPIAPSASGGAAPTHQLAPAPAGAASVGWGASPAASGPIEADELDAFLRQSLVATLSYLADDGYPATVPLWYAWDGAAFWLASRPGSEWVEHVRHDPRVSLAVSESQPPLRRVLARGRLMEVDDPTGRRWAAVEAQLAARYAGFDAAREPAAAGRGRLLTLEPERLIAWRGLLRHPKLPPAPDRPGPTAWRHLG